MTLAQFPADVIAAADAAHTLYYPRGPYASVSLAQWAVESAYGHSEPPDSNNPFGIKAIPGQAYVVAMTREVLHGQSVTIPQHFAKYSSLTEAFDAHAKLLATSPIYAAAQIAKTPDAYVAEMALHYATAPNYAAVLLALMRAANLYQFDEAVQTATILAPSNAAPPAPATAAPPSLSDRLDDVQANLATKMPTPAHEGIIAKFEALLAEWDHVLSEI